MRRLRSKTRRAGLFALAICAAIAVHSPIADATTFARDFSIDKLDALLAESPRTHRPVDDVAELVHLLPDELRQNFTFVYKSRSPFATAITPKQPRVILFSQDASFIATFIGDPNGVGHDIFEMLIFDEDMARFVPAVRVLPAAARQGTHLDTSGCATCHGADPRPVFDSYPLWPGFYGSVQDTFPRSLPASRREYDDYVGFLRTEARRGVYAGLRWIKGSRVSPYMAPENFSDEKMLGEADTLRYQPNTRLGMALGDLNRQRIFRKLSSSDGFADRERELLRMLLDCRADQAKLEDRDIAAAVKAENAARLVRLGADPREKRDRFQMQELHEVHNLTQIDLLAKHAGVDRADWSMAMEPRSLSFYDGILGGVVGGRSYYLKEDLVLELLRDLSRRSRQFEPFFSEHKAFSSLGYPFGHKLDLVRAAASCAFLH